MYVSYKRLSIPCAAEKHIFLSVDAGISIKRYDAHKANVRRKDDVMSTNIPCLSLSLPSEDADEWLTAE
ncbi:hypothetical protein A0H81_08334 [Grifola frondosa]|uniref:Uncharacterized protein n=1 Tax=Grifola frondosa TaxID=5627 RepID=A0A1C7M378_GRIFR|nr:hypothetical protein A0H81_08334 [Grifola frondosa]